LVGGTYGEHGKPTEEAAAACPAGQALRRVRPAHQAGGLKSQSGLKGEEHHGEQVFPLGAERSSEDGFHG